MKKYLILSILMAFIMTLFISLGFITGDFLNEGSMLMKMPWGRMSLVDIYVGIFFIVMWIYYREQSIFKTFLWVIVLFITGNFATAIYIIIALVQSKGNVDLFFKGKNYKNTK